MLARPYFLWCHVTMGCKCQLWLDNYLRVHPIFCELIWLTKICILIIRRMPWTLTLTGCLIQGKQQNHTTYVSIGAVLERFWFFYVFRFIFALTLLPSDKMFKEILLDLLGHSQLICSSAFQLMNDEHQVGWCQIFSFNFIWIPVNRVGIKIFILYSRFHHKLDMIPGKLHCYKGQTKQLINTTMQ